MPADRLTRLEMEAWSGLLRTHALLSRETERRLVKSHGMAMSTYDVLLRLAWAGEQGLRMTELARQVLMSSGGLTRLVDRLEAEGLILRTRSADDLRGYHAQLTQAGRDALTKANRAHLHDVRELFLSQLSAEELEILAGVWQRIKARHADLDLPTYPDAAIR